MLSLKAGGTGLNLTAASHVIHFDRWWNPAVENQATDRAFRIGQQRNVLVHKFVCRGTVEEKIDALIEEKTPIGRRPARRRRGENAHGNDRRRTDPVRVARRGDERASRNSIAVSHDFTLQESNDARTDTTAWRWIRYGGWAPYVPVAERRRRAMKKMDALRKKGVDIQPVEIDGRKIAKTFWGEAWCEHLESFSDFENRLPRGRTYVRNGSVCHLAIAKGQIEAKVSGSELYNVKVDIKTLPARSGTTSRGAAAGRSARSWNCSRAGFPTR